MIEISQYPEKGREEGLEVYVFRILSFLGLSRGYWDVLGKVGNEGEVIERALGDGAHLVIDEDWRKKEGEGENLDINVSWSFSWWEPLCINKQHYHIGSNLYWFIPYPYPLSACLSGTPDGESIFTQIK